ncbi:uncharacterized protein LOC108905395 [Anoplophora glabripennis]|uniref:uncharacterized protein LOC108905395 n=1 Tax=Anoplophora glabripennis TaxID=217634 RepID=UPI00087556AA|nr:uncharacterized protein LOC108905395 [Anoplophora glabripennis]
MNSIVCKIFVYETKDQRVLKPRKIDEKENLDRFVRANSVKKCLFGAPDRADTKRMLQDQYEVDRKRFIDRFGFDVAEFENEESEGNNENVNHDQGQQQISKKCVNGRRILKGQRRVFKPHNSQAVITDFYPSRKNVQSTDLPKQSKEN